jgi:hypothetical protein
MSELEDSQDDTRLKFRAMMLRWPPDHQALFQQDTDLEELIVDVGLQFHSARSAYWMDRIARVLLAVPPQALAKAKRMLPWITGTLVSVISTKDALLTDYSLQYAILEVLKSGSLENWIPLIPKTGRHVWPTFFPSVDEAKAIRAQHAKTIFDNCDKLRRLLQASEKVIKDRWTAAEPKLRTRILKCAWPGINTRHLPDVRDFLSGKTPQIEACLWPHINVEDLSEDWTHLIGFLESRSRHPPWVFYWLDRRSWTLAELRQHVQLHYLSGYFMEINGKETVADYGNMIPQELLSPAKLPMRYQWVDHVGAGLKTMEIQAHTYSFLLKVCLVIMETTEEEFESSHNHLIPSVLLPAPTVSLISESTIDMFTKYPYRVSGFDRLEFDTLLQDVAASRDWAERFYQSLRQDPGHFIRTLNEMHEHQMEQVLLKTYVEECMRKKPRKGPSSNVIESKDELKGKHSLLRVPQRRPSYWNGLLMQLVRDAIWKVLMWDDLHNRLSKIYNWLKPSATNAAMIGPDKDLPEHIYKELEHVISRLCHIIIVSSIDLGRLLAGSPPLRGQFCSLPAQGADPNGKNYVVERRNPLNALGNVSEITWIIHTFVFAIPNFECSSLLDLLQRSIDNPAEKELLTGYIQRTVSDIGLLSRCRTVIVGLDPWSMAVEASQSRVSEDTVGFYNVNTRILNLLSSRKSLKIWYDVANSFCETTPEKIYPEEEKTKNTAITDARKKAEAVLANFWKDVDEDLQVLRVEYPILEDTRQLKKRNAKSRKRTRYRANRRRNKKGKEMAEEGVEYESEEELIEEEQQEDDLGQVGQDWIMQEEAIQEEAIQEGVMQEEVQGETASISEATKKSGIGFKRAREAEDAEEERPRKTARIGVEKKPKIKTRGEADPSRSTSSTPTPVQPSPPPPLQFTVPEKDMKVWRALFYHELTGGGRPGKLIWKDFLRAMRTIGFTARQGTGSIWNFTPPQVLHQYGNACFHQPHGPAWNYTEARIAGKYLSSRYPVLSFSGFAVA